MGNQRVPEIHLLPITGVTEAYGVHGTLLGLEGWGGGSVGREGGDGEKGREWEVGIGIFLNNKKKE